MTIHPAALASFSKQLGQQIPDEFIASPVDRIYRDLEDTWLSNFQRAAATAHSRGNLKDVVPRLAAPNIERLTGWLLAKQELRNAIAHVSMDQLSLGIDGDFVPSVTLANLWTQSLKEMGRSAGAVSIVETGFNAIREFSQTFHDLVSMVGEQERYKARPDYFVARAGRFSASWQMKICDTFLVIPDLSTPFLKLLIDELLLTIGKTAKVSGDWGEMVVGPSNTISLALRPAVYETDPNFEEAEDIT